YHLVYYYMRTGTQVERTTQFLNSVYLPSAKRNGITANGFFSPVIGEHSPYILALDVFPSFAAMETIHRRFADDKEYVKGADDYNNIADPAYIRMESSLLYAFDGLPSLEAPPTDAKRAPRVFELRTYESVNEKASRRKIKMFEDGEIAIFRRLGMAPVFFG